jgi:cell division protein FtsN
MLTGALIALGSWIEPAMAATFGQASVSQNSMIAVAVPHTSGYYSLLVLEQISSEKPCWKESGSSPTRVEPLLLDFNFTQICGRSTDSNGYSLRIADRDIGMDYRLSLQKRGNDLALVGLPRSSQAPFIEVGRTRGIQPGLLKIILGPGWQFAKRTYSSKTLGHVYFSRTTPVYAARTTKKSVVRPRPLRPIASAKPLVAPNPPNSGFNAKGALSSRSDTIASSKPTRIQPISPQPSATSSTLYRVGVLAASPAQQALIRSKMPQAFRTSYQGKTVLQVGLFTDALKADSLQSELKRQGFEVLVSPKKIATGSRTQSFSSPAGINSPFQSALSVPSENVPIGQTRGAKGVYAHSAVPSEILPPPPPQDSTMSRIRVVVPISSQSQQTQIRALVPTAFQSRYNRQRVMQVGSFTRAEEAKTVINLLEKNGFKPIQDQPQSRK